MYVTERYILPSDIIESIKNKSYQFGYGGFGEIVYHSNYSRLMENGKQEKWIDTCVRVVQGVMSIRKDWYIKHSLKWDKSYWDSIASEMIYYFYTLRILPPGRGLWAQGTNYVYEKGSMALNNCGAAAIREDSFVEDVGWIMDALMCGTGVGLREFIDTDSIKSKLEDPKEKRVKIKLIEDSREGWVSATEDLLNSYRVSSKHYIELDYSNIRKAGTAIRGFGGTASGSEPLAKLHKRIRSYLLNLISGKHNSTRVFADIANAVGACIVAGNVRRCLPKGTLVYTKEGLVKIEDVKAGDKVLTSDKYCEVTENIYQGPQILLNIKTELGEIKCTFGHRLAVLNNDYSYGWKRAGDLKSSDTLVFVNNVLLGVKTLLPTTTCKNIFIPDLDDSMAWFFGMLHGNGCVFPNFKRIGFNAYVSLCTHKDYVSIFTKCREQLRRFGINTYEPLRNDRCSRVVVQSKQLAYYLSQFKTANTCIDIPSFILRGTTDIRGAYLAGLFDSDGSCKTRPLMLVSSIYYEFIRQIQALYASFGITSRIKGGEDRGKKNRKPIYNLTLIGKLATAKFNKFIGKYSLKYQEKEYYKYNSSLDNVNNNLIPIKITNIMVNKNKVDTYDLTIKDKNEFVIQGGILVHNSAEIILGSPNNETLLNLKNYKKYPEREEIGWLSNNTVIFENKADFYRLNDVVKSICVRGEPGIMNLANVQKYARYGDVSSPDKAYLANPCFHGDTLLLSKTRGLVKIKDVEVGDYIYTSESWAKITHKFNNGKQDIYKYETSEGSICLTEDHKIMENGTKVKIKDGTYIDYFYTYKTISPVYIKNSSYLCNDYVYDITVDNKSHTFLANGFNTSNCSEIPLEDRELCNLIEIFPIRSKSKREFVRMCEIATIYAITVSLLPTHITSTNEVIARNRRIGVSISGIADWFDNHNSFKIVRFMRTGYDCINSMAKYMNAKAGVPSPIRLTTVKPSGTVSLLGGVSPGMHYPVHKYAIRRMRVASDSRLLHVLEASGLPMEDDYYSKDGTRVLEYPIYTGGTRPASEVSAWEQFALLALLQREWSDNMVSSTIYFKKDEQKDLGRMLAHYLPLIKSVSLLPSKIDDTVYPQMPYEEISEKEYIKRRDLLKNINWSELEGSDGAEGKFCSNDTCDIS